MLSAGAERPVSTAKVFRRFDSRSGAWAVAVSGGSEIPLPCCSLQKDHTRSVRARAQIVGDDQSTMACGRRRPRKSDVGRRALRRARHRRHHRTLPGPGKPATGLPAGRARGALPTAGAGGGCDGAGTLSLTGTRPTIRPRPSLMRRAKRAQGERSAGMARRRFDDGRDLVLRPLLARASGSRASLTERDVGWIDDPSNAMRDSSASANTRPCGATERGDGPIRGSARRDCQECRGKQARTCWRSRAARFHPRACHSLPSRASARVDPPGLVGGERGHGVARSMHCASLLAGHDRRARRILPDSQRRGGCFASAPRADAHPGRETLSRTWWSTAPRRRHLLCREARWPPGQLRHGGQAVSGTAATALARQRGRRRRMSLIAPGAPGAVPMAASSGRSEIPRRALVEAALASEPALRRRFMDASVAGRRSAKSRSAANSAVMAPWAASCPIRSTLRRPRAQPAACCGARNIPPDRPFRSPHCQTQRLNRTGCRPLGNVGALPPYLTTLNEPLKWPRSVTIDSGKT